MRCVKCGAELKEEARFCPKCGTKVPVQQDVEQIKADSDIAQETEMLGKVVSTNTSDKAEWYYLSGSEQYGPMLLSAIVNNIRAGNLTRETLVWKSGMPNWDKAVNTELTKFFNNIAPAVPDSAISDKWLWAMATAPYGAFFIIKDAIISSGTYMTQETFDTLSIIIFIALNSFFGYMDEREFAKTGRKNPVAWYASALVPVYLYLRGDKTNHKSYLPCVVWCVLFVMTFLV